MDFVFVQCHYGAVRVVTRGRAVERERDGTVGERREFPALQVERRSLFSSTRQHADGPNPPVSDARAGLHADIVGAGAAAADAQAPALSDVSVIRGAHRDRALRRLVAQNLWPPLLPFLAKPARDGLDDAVASDGRREESAVEEDRVGADRSGRGTEGRRDNALSPSPFLSVPRSLYPSVSPSLCLSVSLSPLPIPHS